MFSPDHQPRCRNSQGKRLHGLAGADAESQSFRGAHPNWLVKTWPLLDPLDCPAGFAHQATIGLHRAVDTWSQLDISAENLVIFNVMKSFVSQL